MVGYSYGVTGDHAFLYSAGVVTGLGLYNQTSRANGINNSGQIVGWYHVPGTGNNQAFIYDAGNIVNLGSLGPGSISNSFGFGINNRGQSVGRTTTVNGLGHAFLWSEGAMTDLTVNSSLSTSALDINENGQVVGFIENQTSDNGAFLYTDGVRTDLTFSISNNPGWVLREATAINDNGQIVGYGTAPSGEDHAFLLTPVPEPGSLALLAFCGAAALLRRRIAA